ncbi:hypothetical protein CMV_018267 [Castanea mollissima]|uniref:Uncharacterized protein n=1 Tax=Castanea mollissima TaxID=60419 RepID=A0A8J4QVD7_9ROSI|nr:hypothetical protein CMV_018267 [Castanea mollissima]
MTEQNHHHHYSIHQNHFSLFSVHTSSISTSNSVANEPVESAEKSTGYAETGFSSGGPGKYGESIIERYGATTISTEPEMGAAAAGAYALNEIFQHEKHDPEHAPKHKIEEEIAAAAAVGAGGFAFHEHHEKIETKEEEEEAHGKKHHHLFG